MSEQHSHFADVYEEHVWRVYGFLAYRVGDRDLAEDLTQATFERALRAWSRFDASRGSEKTWLIAIARNLLVDHLRQQRADLFEAVDERFLPPTPGPEERLTGSDELVAVVSRLPEREQEVLALRFGGDLDAPAIAALLGISIANVHQIQSRSLRKLRSALEPAPPGTVAVKHGR